MTDLYTWCAIYQDDTWTYEYSEDRPDGRGFAEIEQKPVKAIELYARRDGMLAHRMNVPDGAEPVFFRRRMINIQTQERTTTHCIGWKLAGNDVYLFINNDGSTLLTNDLQAV